MTLLIPTAEEVRWWLLATTRHVCHIEYYLNKLGVGDLDPERPHDIVGPGNKFEWGVIRGLAIQARDPKPDFETQVLPSLLLHRVQYHHRRWNNPNPENPLEHLLEATADDMRLGAVDAVCSLLEPRGYQGGTHSFEEIAEICEKNPPHKVSWLRDMILRMRDLRPPELEGITLEHVPNVGLPKLIHEKVLERLYETRRALFGSGCRYEGM